MHKFMSMGMKDNPLGKVTEGAVMRCSLYSGQALLKHCQVAEDGS